MKFRTSLILSVILLAMFAMASSCKKNYTCQCKFHFTNYPGLPDSFSREYSIYDSKSGAKSKCSAQSGTFQNNNIDTKETCELY